MDVIAAYKQGAANPSFPMSGLIARLQMVQFQIFFLDWVGYQDHCLGAAGAI